MADEPVAPEDPGSNVLKGVEGVEAVLPEKGKKSFCQKGTKQL